MEKKTGVSSGGSGSRGAHSDDEEKAEKVITRQHGLSGSGRKLIRSPGEESARVAPEEVKENRRLITYSCPIGGGLKRRQEEKKARRKKPVKPSISRLYVTPWFSLTRHQPCIGNSTEKGQQPQQAEAITFCKESAPRFETGEQVYEMAKESQEKMVRQKTEGKIESSAQRNSAPAFKSCGASGRNNREKGTMSPRLVAKTTCQGRGGKGKEVYAGPNGALNQGPPDGRIRPRTRLQDSSGRQMGPHRSTAERRKKDNTRTSG